MNTDKKIKRNSLRVATAFAAALFMSMPVKAEICFNAGAGVALMESAADSKQIRLPEIVTDKDAADSDKAKAAGTAAVTEGASDTSSQIGSDGVTEVSAKSIADEVAKADKKKKSDSKTKEVTNNSLSAKAPVETVIDTTTVSGDSTAAAEVEESSDPAPVLTVGAGSVIPDSSIFTEEEMADEFAEEDAAGGAFGYTHLGVVQVDDHLNVRASAEEGSKIVGKMESDAGCEILDVKGNMAHITSGSVEGYVNLDYLVTGPEAVEYASSVVKETATVNADGLKLREDKSLDAPVYNMVAYGEQLEVVDKSDDWIGVKYDGKKLYVSAEYVSVGIQLKTALNMTEFLYGAGVSDVRMELCEYAKKFVGNPYVWGGTSLTKGADCSGFVMSVYAKYGVSLPHSSRAQANCGTRISMAEARPGDLVFYAKGKRINHVGIYIGGGQIVNASSPKTGIRIANAYYRTPVAVVRILQD